MNAFRYTHNYLDCDPSVTKVIEEFVCRIFPKIKKVDEARIASFEKANFLTYKLSDNQ